METNTVEIETITEHQLPDAQRLDLKRLDGAEERETKLKMAGEHERRHGEKCGGLDKQKRSRAK